MMMGGCKSEMFWSKIFWHRQRQLCHGLSPGWRKNMKKIKVEYKEDENKNRFPYIDIGSEEHGKVTFRLWIAGSLLEKDKDGNSVIIFPVKGAKVMKTDKGNIVMRKEPNSTVYYIYVECGYRGRSGFDILTKANEVEEFTFAEYVSQLGSLGISLGALVNSNQSVKYRWYKTGRLYGAPDEGVIILMSDGTVKEIDMISDGLEAIAELPKETE